MCQQFKHTDEPIMILTILLKGNLNIEIFSFEVELTWFQELRMELVR